MLCVTFVDKTCMKWIMLFEDSEQFLNDESLELKLLYQLININIFITTKDR